MLHVGQTLSQHVGLTLDRWAESHWANIGKRHWADELSDENPMGQRRFAIWDANFQRFWPIDRGAESLEIRPPTVHSNFTVESKRYKKIWHPRVSVTYLCFLCMFTKLEVLLCISMLLIDENKLTDSDSEQISRQNDWCWATPPLSRSLVIR